MKSNFCRLGSGNSKMEECIRTELSYLVQAVNSHQGKPFNILVIASAKK